MADLNKKYQKILDELTQKIKDPNELDFVKTKINELCIEYMASIDKILELERKQDRLESKVRKIGHELSIIEEDIYVNGDIDDSDFLGDKMHDNDYEFEITCPYCSYEFLADESCKGETEIECPRCHNIIELDWKEECSGDCSSCGGHCSEEDTENENGSLAVKEDESENSQSQNSKGSTNNNSKTGKNNNSKAKNKNQNTNKNDQNVNYLDNNINQSLPNDNEDDM